MILNLSNQTIVVDTKDSQVIVRNLMRKETSPQKRAFLQACMQVKAQTDTRPALSYS